ncbi:CCA tRNA nucleotidyltransferase [Staphylococcus sp. HMSC70A05]|uniref:CCA tRNA nucleotidyltransferase n=1 Tax=Staphylococcus sp. HMSC70A05 TaxID=1608895 RepID=UPI0008A8BBDB|nr:CCA tRNA nucleotidyltransferase [Staphylococcus sp. HMSC70A05]OHS56888.1 CCA tRNA nucleotidyltransferase [Staphylococcus sp. HMSC70A05]
MSYRLFEQAKPLLTKIQQHGYEAYFVGGSVRDYIMGRDIHDIDITTSATPDEIETIFQHTIPIGKAHGTINVVYGQHNYEVTTFRAEEEYTDHRCPSEVTFVRNLYQDVERRDFTMNAIAMDKSYQIYDYFGGQADIKQHIIRTVGEPHERFEEDALRILRGLRFEAQLGFTIDTTTFLAMQQRVADTAYLSIERIIVELKKLIQGHYVSSSYKHMIQLGLFNHIPFFESIDMNKFIVTEPMSFELWIASLLFATNSQFSLTSLKISNNEKQKIKQLLSLLQLLNKIKSKQDLRLLVYDYGSHSLLEILNHRQMFQDQHIKVGNPVIINPEVIHDISQSLIINQRQDIAICGYDLINFFNKKRGPWIKTVLRMIEVAIVNNNVQNNKEQILKWVKKHVEI